MISTFFMYLFYFLVVAALVYEMMYVGSPEVVVKLKGLTAKQRTALIKKGSAEELFVIYLGAMTLIVCLIGLMSTQWFLFLVYFAISILMSLVYRVPMFRSTIMVRLDGIICSALVVIILLNKFHLHYTAKEIIIFIF